MRKWKKLTFGWGKWEIFTERREREEKWNIFNCLHFLGLNIALKRDRETRMKFEETFAVFWCIKQTIKEIEKFLIFGALERDVLNPNWDDSAGARDPSLFFITRNAARRSDHTGDDSQWNWINKKQHTIVEENLTLSSKETENTFRMMIIVLKS